MYLNSEAAECGLPRLALSPNEAAKNLGVSRSRIYTAIREKELTAYRDRKRTLIPLVELNRWMHALPFRGRTPDPATAIQATY